MSDFSMQVVRIVSFHPETSPAEIQKVAGDNEALKRPEIRTALSFAACSKDPRISNPAKEALKKADTQV